MNRAARTERLVREIMQHATPELQRRRSSRGVVIAISRWRRAILTGSAGLFAASFAALLLLSDDGELQVTDPVLTEAVLPAEITEWLNGSDDLDPFLMVAAFEEVSR
ncbi:MAG TPA: hypothetical protein VM198_01630 [Longimicrobiales bacterium]|nr:hypothetical protein [Longimicrobiales bacterium]